MATLTQSCPDLPCVSLVGREGMDRLNISHNEKSIDFERSKSVFFLNLIRIILSYRLKYALVQSVCTVLWLLISVEGINQYLNFFFMEIVINKKTPLRVLLLVGCGQAYQVMPKLGKIWKSCFWMMRSV